MRFLRKVHALIGIVSTLNLLLLITTGLLIQSRESLALEDHYVSRRYLPASYRPHDDPSGIRSDIVITDLHSGRIFGRPGVIIVNSLAVAWLVLATSGVILYTYKYFRRNGGDRRAE